MGKEIYSTQNIYTDELEQIHYSNDQLPYYVRELNGKHSHVRNLPHWHYDIEIMIMVDEELDMNVEGEMYHLKHGDGLLINSCRLHHGEEIATDYICIRIHPMLLCANEYIEENYVAPLLGGDAFDALYLDCTVPYQKKIIDLVKGMYKVHSDNKDGKELLIEKYAYEIWYQLYTNIEINKQTKEPSTKYTLLKSMIGYIQDHYSENVKLKDIADSVNISISSCNDVFQKQIHLSPISYLLQYRLYQSRKMLYSTSIPINEIAFRCGFSSPSYFIECFRKEYMITPKKFRNTVRED